MQHRTADHGSWVFCCLILGSALWMSVTAQTTAFSRADITGNDIDCGQGSKKCRICGDINSIESSCRANPTCVAFSFDNSCGYLKTAGEPRAYREGYTVFLLVGKSPTAAAPAASPAAGAPAASSPLPAAASPAPAAASPAPSAAGAAAASPSPSVAPSPAATQPAPVTPASQVPAASPAPAAAATPAPSAAAGGKCSLSAWDQCGGAGNDCTGPGRSCVDGPFPGCTCPADYPCQKKDSYFYQCAPPGHFGETSAAPSNTVAVSAAAPSSPPPQQEQQQQVQQEQPATTTQTATAAAQSSSPGSSSQGTYQRYFTGQPQGTGSLPIPGIGGFTAGPGGFFSPGGRKLLLY